MRRDRRKNKQGGERVARDKGRVGEGGKENTGPQIRGFEEGGGKTEEMEGGAREKRSRERRYRK